MPSTDTIRAGDLNHRLVIQNLVETSDTFSAAATESWVTLSTVWADIKPMSGNEIMRAQQAESRVDTRIRIRYLAGLKARARGSESVENGTVYYDFISILPNRQRGYIDILALQRNA